jgi:hypothetical protein
MEANMEIENDINLIRNKRIHFPENGAKSYTQPFSYKLFKLKPQFYFIFCSWILFCLILMKHVRQAMALARRHVKGD